MSAWRSLLTACAVIVGTGASAGVAVIPSQLLNKKDLISSSDYPIGALLLDEEGETVVSVGVDQGGRVTTCVVDHSSGTRALDEQTCRLLQKRAKFRPAHDDSGHPVPDVHQQRVNWSIEDSELPASPWTVRVLALVGPNSNVRNCAIQTGGTLEASPPLTIDCSELSGAFAVTPELLAKIAGHETVLVFDKQFVPTVVNSIDTPPDLKTYTLLGREVVKLRIDPDGAVTECIKANTEGSFPPVVGACQSLPRHQFKIPAKKNGRAESIWGTATMSVYAGH